MKVTLFLKVKCQWKILFSYTFPNLFEVWLSRRNLYTTIQFSLPLTCHTAIIWYMYIKIYLQKEEIYFWISVDPRVRVKFYVFKGKMQIFRTYQGTLMLYYITTHRLVLEQFIRAWFCSIPHCYPDNPEALSYAYLSDVYTVITKCF